MGKLLFKDDWSKNNDRKSSKLLLKDDWSTNKNPMQLEVTQGIKKESLPHSIATGLENSIIGAGDALRNLLSLGYAEPYTKQHPETAGKAYNAGNILGNIAGFLGGGEALEALPYARGIANSLGNTGLGGLGKRLLGSEIYGVATNKDRAQGAKEGLQGGLLGEAIGLPFRTIGAAAEKINPIKAAQKNQESINNEAQLARQAMQQAYAPVHEKYGNSLVTLNPRKFMRLNKNTIQYFTPDINRIYRTFMSEPTFNNLHRLQSKIGVDAAKIKGSREQVDKYQALSHARNSILNNIQGLLSNDEPMLNQYNLGRTIGRQRYFPFLSSENLTKIAEGRKTDFSPRKLINEIQKVTEQKDFPENHYLHSILQRMQGQESRGHAYKHAGTLAAGLAGASAGLPGAAIAGGAAHFLSPHAFALAQNPSIINLLKNYLNPALRSTTQQIVHKPLELEVTTYRKK